MKHYTQREHVNLRAERAGGLLEGWTLTVQRVNGLPDGEALVGQDLDSALATLQADGWVLVGPPPSRPGSKGTMQIFLYRDTERPRTPPPPTPEQLDARAEQRRADQLAATKRTRELREKYGTRPPARLSEDERAALSEDERRRLAALDAARRGMRR